MCPEHSGREAYECANNRQHAADEEGRISILIHPAIRSFEVFWLQQKQAPILFSKRAAAVESEKIGRDGAEKAAKSTGQCRQVEIHFALLNQESGGGHDCLTGKRNIC